MQKGASVSGLPPQNLGCKILDDIAMSSAECCRRLRRFEQRLVTPTEPKRKRGHLQSCDPAFGAFFERARRFRVDAQAHGLSEKHYCFFVRESQVVQP